MCARVCVCVCVLCNVYVSSVLHVFRLLLTHQSFFLVRVEIVFGVWVCVLIGGMCVCVCVV